MHEMSIAQSMFEIIEEVMRANDLSRVTEVKVRIGRMAAVVPDSLEFCFEVLARGTPVEGAKLNVTLVPLTGKCNGCGGEFQMEEYNFECPACRSSEIRLTGGEELCLEEVEGE